MASEYINPFSEIKEIKTDDLLSFIFEQFSKPPYENLFYLNLQYFIDNATEVKFEEKWNYSPQRAAHDIYGSQFYYPLIFLLNPIPNVFYFTAKNFKTLRVIPLHIINNFRSQIWG